MRVDFQQLLPSLKATDVARVLRQNKKRLGIDVNSDDLTFIRNIVCRNKRLTIGAPTSPQLSNAIMFEFDDLWSRRARAFGITYTRYADDLYFSTNRPKILQELLIERLRQYSRTPRQPTLKINDNKTAFSSRKRRRLAAGLVLTSDRKISIGRQRKRVIKAQVFQFKNGALAPEQIASLRGWISYIRSVEPTFIEDARTQV